MRSAGICWFRFCWIPTFLSPGGRTFAGGDKMPLVIPCPKAEATSDAVTSALYNIELKDCFILLTCDTFRFHEHKASLERLNSPQPSSPAWPARSFAASPKLPLHSVRAIPVPPVGPSPC